MLDDIFGPRLADCAKSESIPVHLAAALQAPLKPVQAFLSQSRAIGQTGVQCDRKLLRFAICVYFARSLHVKLANMINRDSPGGPSAPCGSTAAGNGADAVTLEGTSYGLASGIAPRARLAVYKALWLSPGASEVTGAESDLIAAVDQAVADGVDVISFSIGGKSDFFDLSELSFLLAAQVTSRASLTSRFVDFQRCRWSSQSSRHTIPFQ